MSNLSDIKKNALAEPEIISIEASTLTASAPAKSNRWSFIQNDLTKAMDTWQELEKSESAISPEEEQLVKIKTIIGQLKNKLEQF